MMTPNASIPIPMIRRLYLTAFLGLALAGCESEPKFALSPVTMDCDQGSCLVTFELTNTSDGELPLIYDISLSQNYIRDPNKSGLVVVGAADGEIDAEGLAAGVHGRQDHCAQYHRQGNR